MAHRQALQVAAVPHPPEAAIGIVCPCCMLEAPKAHRLRPIGSWLEALQVATKQGFSHPACCQLAASACPHACCTLAALKPCLQCSSLSPTLGPGPAIMAARQLGYRGLARPMVAGLHGARASSAGGLDGVVDTLLRLPPAVPAHAVCLQHLRPLGCGSSLSHTLGPGPAIVAAHQLG
jgi:hypothetical protein